MRDANKRAQDAMKRAGKYGLDPYNTANAFGRVYEWKWRDDVRRSEYAANRKLAANRNQYL